METRYNIPTIKSWERCHLEDRESALPVLPGVYAVIEGSNIYYVGLSRCLRERWKSDRHHRYPQAASLDSPQIAWLPCEEYAIADVERQLINELAPPWNYSSIPGWARKGNPEPLINVRWRLSLGAIAIALLAFGISFCGAQQQPHIEPVSPAITPPQTSEQWPIVANRPTTATGNATIDTPNGESLNLRDDAGVVIKVLSDGDRVTITGRAVAGFLPVRASDGTAGFVSAEYVGSDRN